MKNTDKNIRIILLDDESSFVDACATTLKHSYQVVKTSSPFEALSMLDASRNLVDLVICDFNMPGMTGLEFLGELKKIKVKTPVMLLTGAILDEKDPRYSGFAKIIRKPFSSEQLLRDVASVLEGGQKIPVAAKAAVLLGLEAHLKQLGVDTPERLSPESSLQTLGPGEARDAFLAWYHLKALRNL